MGVDAFRRAHIQRGEGPQALAGQPAVHGRGRKDHRHGDLFGPLIFVGQHQMGRARTDSIFGFGTDTLQPEAQRLWPAVGREGAVDHRHLRAELLEHHLIFGIGDEGAFQHEDFGLGRAFIQHVLQVAEPRLERHDPRFAQAVDRRVGDLAEVLAEEMRQRAILFGQNRNRGVIAHRGDHFLAVLGHRGQDLLQLFDRIAGRDLALAQLGPGEGFGFRHVAQHRVQVHDLFDPFAIRLACGQFILHGGVVIKLALFGIDGNHLPRPKRAFFTDGRFIDRHHARFGPGNQQAIPRDDIAHRTQAVAVKPATNPAAIGHRQRGGAVPRLHHGIAIGIHVGPGLGQLGRGFRPGFGDQHGFGHGGRAARADQHFEHRIQRARIRSAAGDDRLDVFGHVAKGGRGHADLMALHPVDVALQRVDFAVMGQHAEGLGQPPLREGVGRIALVIDREGAFETLIFQIGIEDRHLFGQHHALVDDRPAGQAAEIAARDPGGGHGLFDAATDDVELALELFVVDVLFAADQDLFDLGARRIGLFAQHRGIHRHMAPAIDVVAHAQNFGFHDGPAAFLRAKIGARQEDLADRDQLVHVGLMPGAADLIVEELDRDLHVDARAVARLAIGINGTTVPDRAQGINARVHDLAARLARNRHDQTHAAGRMFVIFLVEAMFGHPCALGLFGLHPGFVIDRHG